MESEAIEGRNPGRKPRAITRIAVKLARFKLRSRGFRHGRLKIKLRRVGSGRICAKRAQVAGNGLKSQEMGLSRRKWGGISPRLP
jgi:hypothetical protein